MGLRACNLLVWLSVSHWLVLCVFVVSEFFYIRIFKYHFSVGTILCLAFVAHPFSDFFVKGMVFNYASGLT